MTQHQIDLKNGEVAWEAFSSLSNDAGMQETLKQAETMVKTLGAEGTYEICGFDKKNLPPKAKELMMLALKYLEHKYQLQSEKN